MVLNYIVCAPSHLINSILMLIQNNTTVLSQYKKSNFQAVQNVSMS